MLEGEGRFGNRPYGGLVAWSHVTGDHEGRPYGKGMGPRIREDNGGGRAVSEPPLRIAKNVGFDSIVAVYLRGNDGYGM